MTKGSKPCLRGSGFSRRSTSAGESSTFLAKGNSFSPHMETEPKAEGSVHIPYSDQNPGRKIVSGKVRMALRLSSRKSALVGEVIQNRVPRPIRQPGTIDDECRRERTNRLSAND